MRPGATSRPTRRTALGLAAVAGLSACGEPRRPPSEGEGGPRQLTYGGDPSQVAELYRPAGTPRGVVVVLHGGFWLASYDLSLGRPLAEDLAGRGWAALNVEYRRVGNGGGVPSTLDDVSAAVDLLDGVGLGDGAVVTLGHSAGGQLAVWAAGRERLGRWSSARVRVTHAVSQAGVLDLRGAVEEGLGGGAVEELVGGSPEEVPDSYALADPTAQVPLEVPVWCVHGTDDGTVPLAQSRTYVDAARAAGGDATLVEVPGDHLDQIDTGTDAWAGTREVLDGIAG
ncbi:alpha/beta hydrolase [Phycicoccus sp. CSK15P-2]|uniref:alpha/beta hydrolase family protein n=1 Tax=Phycicoccus sp. CSK15P-2 TaxID=2807627 RepID=UPI00194F4F41|nr:alpha/beta hydrolase [Phycicoccus sp. CSK15P-2]MBM6403984.1 alpha/beta hydrolase [Phycicoccus sp. CSK15P-2]